MKFLRAVVVLTVLLVRLILGQQGAGDCLVPPYVLLYPSDVTAEILEGTVIPEGRCYLACLEEEEDTTVRNETYTYWPTAVVDSTCATHKLVHECTRGCATWSRYSYAQRTSPSTSCRNDCFSDCKSECGNMKSCSNPDSLDRWISRSSCKIVCNRDHCDFGCTLAKTFINNLELSSSTASSGSGSGFGSGPGVSHGPYSLPPQPVAPPTLTPAPCNDRPGCYYVDLESAHPPLGEELTDSSLISPVAFLFRIETENVSYIWMNGHDKVLNLTRYACQNISLTMAVVNKFGKSDYSPSLSLAVDGDPNRIPNPPTDLIVACEEDTRVGFFGHCILNISWLSPTDDRFLDNFTLFIQKKTGNGSIYIQQVLEPAEDGGNLVTLRTGETDSSLRLVMDTVYVITITSTGPDGSRSLGPNNIRTDNALVSRLHYFTCQRFWDGESYFSLEVQWRIPAHWARQDVLEEFLVLTQNDSTSIGVVHVPLEENREIYSSTRSVDTEGQSLWFFFRPQNMPGENFTFTLTLRYANHLPVRSLPPNHFTCSVDGTSPPPSQVQNFTLVSHTVHNPTSLRTVFEWQPPATPNGVLSGYEICISQEPLELNEEPQNSGGSITLCGELQSGTVTSLDFTWTLFTGLCYYYQIRARNAYVYGNWTEPLLLELVARGPPDLTTPTTTLTMPKVTTRTLNLNTPAATTSHFTTPTTTSSAVSQSLISTVMPVSLVVLLAVGVALSVLCILS